MTFASLLVAIGSSVVGVGLGLVVVSFVTSVAKDASLRLNASSFRHK
jgi:F0F1-type ATP synthase membrane subunit c/vacuolar-type H+-ATPase subunit K